MRNASDAAFKFRCSILILLGSKRNAYIFSRVLPWFIFTLLPYTVVIQFSSHSFHNFFGSTLQNFCDIIHCVWKSNKKILLWRILARKFKLQANSWAYKQISENVNKQLKMWTNSWKCKQTADTDKKCVNKQLSCIPKWILWQMMEFYHSVGS